MFFHASCNIHDFTYTQGYYLFKDKPLILRTILRIIHRWKCDWGFYRVMLKDIWKIRRSRKEITIRIAISTSAMATIYLAGVRMAGWRFY